MSDLIKNTAEKDFRARGDRRLFQGTVISKNEETNTCILDVGAYDAQGNPVYLIDVPYQPHNPPQEYDNVTLTYSNISPHSVNVGGGQVGGANNGQVVENGTGVKSLRKSGSTKLAGDITLSAGTNITLTQTGQDIEITASGGGGGTGEGTAPFGDWVTTSTNYTASDTDGVIRITFDGITITLPDASSNVSKCYVFYLVGSISSISIQDGGGVILQMGSVYSLLRAMVVSNGTTWERCL